MENKKIYIYANDNPMSQKIKDVMVAKLRSFNIVATTNLQDDTDLIICIGGDGTFLRFLQENDFPSNAIVGINTGHLGFFQEILPEKIDDFLFRYSQGQFDVQSFNPISACITTQNGVFTHTGLNEIAVKGNPTSPVHLNISINDSFIERFSGDGICVATSAGSTGYNYSLGGGIVDPRLNLIQITPIAPMKSVTYRSITSSIILPADDTVTVLPCEESDHYLNIIFDSISFDYHDVTSVKIQVLPQKINLIRFDNSHFWGKVKSKFL